MLSTTLRKLHRLSRRLWIRVLLIASLGLIALAASKLLDPLIPEVYAEEIGADALDRLLNIIATSMLTVTTFSLTVMVSVHRSAASQFTPRAHRELLKDTTTQTVLATFVGAWIYALTAIVLTSTPFFGDKEIVALFIATIFVLALIVAMTLRWILHLQTLGSLIDTAARMERDAERAIRQRPSLGTQVLHGPLPKGLFPIHARETGFVQAIYEQSLQAAADKAGAQVYLSAPPGKFVNRGQIVAHASLEDEALTKAVLENLHMGALRTTEQDPRFGLIELSEIASKALSPGINDPGTAIDILGRIARVLQVWEARDGEEPNCDRIWLTPVSVDDLVSDGFDAIARDGSTMVEVQIALQKRIAGLLAHGSPELRPALEAAAARARARALEAMTFEPDRERLLAAVAEGIRE